MQIYSGAFLRSADLSKAAFAHSATMTADANLDEANLSGTQFSTDEGNYSAKGVTQIQLDMAVSDIDNLPMLNGVLDAESGPEQINPPTKEPGWLDALAELINSSKEGNTELHSE